MNAVLLLTAPRFSYAAFFAYFEVPNRRWDFDNLVSALKWPLDFLRDAGVIVNDSAARLWPGRIPLQRLAEKSAGSLAIILIERDEQSLADMCAGKESFS